MRERLGGWKAPALFTILGVGLTLVIVGFWVAAREVPDALLVVTSMVLGYALGYARSEVAKAEAADIGAVYIPGEE